MTIPEQRAAVVADSNHGAELTKLPVPKPAEGELLVKVEYTALNPVDWKLLERATPPGSVLNKDYAGTVAAIGPGVTGWKEGDRVSGIAFGGLGGSAGGATEYAAVEAGLAWHVPDSVPLYEAPTYGIAGTTAALALYKYIGAPTPPGKVEGEPWFLVSGGSTQVGLFLIQWAKLAGYRVVATSSEKNFDLLKKYGADEVVSYRDVPAAVAKIKALRPPVEAGAEVAGGPSWDLSGQVLANGKYVAVLEDPNGKAVHVNYGKAFKPNASFDPDVRAWAGEFYKELPTYITKYGIRPTPVTVRDGLAAVPQGLKDLKSGAVSGSKLVFKVE